MEHSHNPDIEWEIRRNGTDMTALCLSSHEEICLSSHEERSRDLYSTKRPFSFLSKEKEEVLNRDEKQLIFNKCIAFCPDNLPDQCLSLPGLRVC